jgi:hypothetical protein
MRSARRARRAMRNERELRFGTLRCRARESEEMHSERRHGRCRRLLHPSQPVRKPELCRGKLSSASRHRTGLLDQCELRVRTLRRGAWKSEEVHSERRHRSNGCILHTQQPVSPRARLCSGTRAALWVVRLVGKKDGARHLQSILLAAAHVSLLPCGCDPRGWTSISPSR